MQNRCMWKCLKYNIPSINIIVLAKKWGRCVCVCEHNPPSPPQYFPGSVSRRPPEDEIFLLTLQSLRTPKVYHKSWLQRHLLLLSSEEDYLWRQGRGHSIEARILWVASSRNPIWTTVGQTVNILTRVAKSQEGLGFSWTSRIIGTGTWLDFLQLALLYTPLSKFSVLLDTATFHPESLTFDISSLHHGKDSFSSLNLIWKFSGRDHRCQLRSYVSSYEQSDQFYHWHPPLEQRSLRKEKSSSSKRKTDLFPE